MGKAKGHLPELFEFECTNCGWDEIVDLEKINDTKRNPWRLARRNVAYVIIGMMLVWAYVLISNMETSPINNRINSSDNIDGVVILPFFKPLIERFRSFLHHRTRVIGGDVNRP